jgi:hypothetical protein
MSTDFETLSQLVDRNGVAGVLIMLSQVCDDKANRLRARCCDSVLARSWERDARKIDAIIVLN